MLFAEFINRDCTAELSRLQYLILFYLAADQQGFKCSIFSTEDPAKISEGYRSNFQHVSGAREVISLLTETPFLKGHRVDSLEKIA